MSKETSINGRARTLERLRTAAILFIACMCGWFVMELELLGTRLLVPYFGSSVYVVMGSVIGVFLLSLSVGYMLGGWLSKRAHGERALGLNLTASGVWLCLLPFFAERVCDGILDLEFGEKWGSLAATFILFGPPTALLGTVSPTAVRWLTRDAESSGLKAGLVLGLSTIASFAGTVVTAFYLIRLSLRGTILLSGALLAATGIAVLLDAFLRRPPPCP